MEDAGAVAVLFRALVGASSLALVHLVQRLGWLPSVVFLALISCGAEHAMQLYGRVCRERKGTSYDEVVQAPATHHRRACWKAGGKACCTNILALNQCKITL